MFSLIIPVFNEEKAIEETFQRALKSLVLIKEQFEIIAIDDGSTDKSLSILKKFESEKIKIISNKENLGYSASIKKGIRKAQGKFIAITDADGTYPVEDLPKMFQIMQESDVDMVVGSRTKKEVHIPIVRKPAKAIVSLLANILTGKKIPDINSGLRIFTKELAEEFWHLYPQRFSFTITITLAALTNGYQVFFMPIEYHKRIGSSSLSSGINGFKNFLGFLGLIVRIMTYFRPLRFFTIPSILLVLGGISLMIYTVITQNNISDSGMLLFVSGLQIGVFGLLADGIVRNGLRK